MRQVLLDEFLVALVREEAQGVRVLIPQKVRESLALEAAFLVLVGVELELTQRKVRV